ncbi:MAG: Trk system potassium transporter TrkA, partial [Succiniclasticum sp.]
IAVTDSDEVNLVACRMAKAFGAKHTVARVRNEEYTDRDPAMLNKTLGVDLNLNPERITANEISHILMTPAALDVDDFADGKVRMFGARLPNDFKFLGVPLKHVRLPDNILIAMIFRKHRMIIPHGDDILEPGDNVYFVGGQEVIKKFETNFEARYDKLERVLLIGAGRAGRMLAQLLEKQGIFVKVIEKDKDRCRLLSEQLNNGLVLCGDGTDIDLLMEEGITEADCVVCLTDDDKLNLLLALLAKHLGAKKTIVRVARNEYVDLMAKVGVDIALSARLLSAAEVMRFIRQGGLVSVALLEGAKAEALELQVQGGCKVAGKTLMRAGLPRECLVCGIVHEGEASVPNGQSVLNAGDRVIVFAQTEVVQDVMDMFAGSKIA